MEDEVGSVLMVAGGVVCCYVPIGMPPSLWSSMRLSRSRVSGMTGPPNFTIPLRLVSPTNKFEFILHEHITGIDLLYVTSMPFPAKYSAI